MAISLHLWLLGPWHATLEGTPLPALPTRYARALLARLPLAHPQPLVRSILVKDLFSTLEPKQAAHSFRTTLYYVRRMLGELLVVSDSGIGLDPKLTISHDVGA